MDGQRGRIGIDDGDELEWKVRSALEQCIARSPPTLRKSRACNHPVVTRLIHAPPGRCSRQAYDNGDRFAELLGEFLSHDPTDHIGPAASRERHNH
jgi:hypothetical protein